MKKLLILCLSAVFLLSGCYDAQSGAMSGGYTGLIFGSAIGGIMDGPRGHDIGTLVGGLGGAVVGAAIGNANQQSSVNNSCSDNSQSNYNQSRYNSSQGYSNDNSVGSNSYSDDSYMAGNTSSGKNNTVSSDVSNNNYTPGDDRINMYNDETYTGSYNAVSPQGFRMDTVGAETTPGFSFKLNPAIEVQNIRLVDASRNRAIDAGEDSKIIFEVMNRSNAVIYDVQPTVVESTGNKHIFISPSVHVERIEPGKGIRYTAMVKADKRLKDGSAHFRIAVMQGNGNVTSAINDIEVPTVGRH